MMGRGQTLGDKNNKQRKELKQQSVLQGHGANKNFSHWF